MIVAVGHQQYRETPLSELRKLCRGDNPVLGDLKSLFDRKGASELGFSVFRL
jgi:UDP-N-acetyl-D-galactosamine dehydrogenase